MDYNIVCKDPSFIGLCNYLANIYKLYKAVQDSGFNNPYYPIPKPSSVPSPYPKPGNHAIDCQPDRFSYLIGSTFDPKTNSFKLKDGASVTLAKDKFTQPFRIIGPDTMVTMDLREDRLNIYYDNEAKKSDKEGTVTKVNCG